MFAPSVGLSAADKRPIGCLAQVLLPVRYRAESGVEFGAEAGLGRTFGGTERVSPCIIPGTECVPGMPLVERNVRGDWAGTLGPYLGFAIPPAA